MRELTLGEVKQVSLDILLEIDRICRENGITYYIAYGTLLGAIRHKGFIPWDNDIDIWIPIEELEQFYHLMEKNSNYEVLSFYGSEKRFPDGFGKISDRRTITRSVYWSGVAEFGVAVDVFPLMPCRKRGFWYDKFSWLRRMVENSIEYQMGGHREAHNPKRRVINLFLRMDNRLHDREYWCKKLYKQMQSVKKSKWLGYPIKGIKGKDIYLAENFSSIQYIEFECHQFPAPAGWKDILSVRYGDFMTPPPDQERITHTGNHVYWKDYDENNLK